MELTPEIYERFMAVDPAQVGHSIDGGYMDPAIKPLKSDWKILGPAYPVRVTAKDSTAIYYGLLHAPTGSILVVDRAGDRTFACVGEIVACVAKRRGVKGIVIDGPATDSLPIKEMDYPVFCRGLSPITTNLQGLSGEVNVTVQCGGAVVHPGDLIFGDADGVVVIPPNRAIDLLEKAEKATENEKNIKKVIEETGFIPTNVTKLFETDIAAMIREYAKQE